MIKTLEVIVSTGIRQGKYKSGNVQSTQSKDTHQRKLLSLRQLQRPEDRHRIDQNQDIRQDMNGRVGEPERLPIETETRDSGIIELGERDTVCPSADDSPCSVHGEESDKKGTGEAHSWG